MLRLIYCGTFAQIWKLISLTKGRWSEWRNTLFICVKLNFIRLYKTIKIVYCFNTMAYCLVFLVCLVCQSDFFSINTLLGILFEILFEGEIKVSNAKTVLHKFWSHQWPQMAKQYIDVRLQLWLSFIVVSQLLNRLFAFSEVRRTENLISFTASV